MKNFLGKVFKVVNILISLSLVFVAACVAFVAIPYFGNQALIVRSGSMEPTIDVGAITVVRQNQAIISPVVNSIPKYTKGDIIAFRSEKNSNTIITHRVYAVERGEEGILYKTKGDANSGPDSWIVDEKNILGKSFFILPSVGKFLSFAKSKSGASLLIIFPAALVILMEIISIISNINKSRKKRQESMENFYFTPPVNSGFRLTGFKVVVMLVILVGLAVPVTFAFLNDTEMSTGNIIQAASSFGVRVTPTPTPNPKTSNLYVSDAYTCPNGASDTSESKGIVTIIKDSSLNLIVTLSGAIPETDYQLWVNQDPGGCPLSAATDPTFIHTDSSGNGTNTLLGHTVVSGAENFWVSLVGGTDVLRSKAVSF